MNLFSCGWTHALCCGMMSLIRMAGKKIIIILSTAAVCGAACFFILWSILPVMHAPKPVASTKVLARDGSVLYDVTPPRDGTRTLVPLSAVPDSLIHAVVASEDARFFAHHGVDWRAVLRALRDRVTGSGVKSGASTIEQQLIKKLFFADRPRSVLQKMREMAAAEYWTIRHSKQETLELYLNSVYLGNSAYGVQAAADVYFHKHVGDLSTAESALLAGMIPAPSLYDPYLHWSAARQRQKIVLQRMRSRGSLSQTEADEAARVEISVFPPRHEIKAPLFVLRVLDELEERYPDIRDGGYVITTTLDPELQSVAEETIRRRLSALAQQQVSDGAAVAMDPQTGEVLAYVGSADYFDEAIHGQVDMAAAKRQPGSALKPFMYLAALMRGYTPATVIADLPVRFETSNGQSYYPRNYNYKYFGPVTLREALASSLNIPAVKVLHEIGLNTFFGTLAQFGLTFPEPPDHYGLGVVLGGGEVSLLDATRAYAELALYSKSVSSVTVREIRDAKGKVLEKESPAQPRLLFEDGLRAAQSSALIADILSDQRARARSFGETSLMELGKGIAAKTGTTKDFHDNWAFGYAPDFVLGVWVGNADNTPMRGVSGITGAVPIWHDIMQSRFEHRDAVRWPAVSGLVQREICATSGLLTNGICPKTRMEKFIEGTEPTKPDDWYIACGGKTYLVPPAEYAAWMTAAGHERPTCGGHELAGFTGTPRILSPLDGDVYERDQQVDGLALRIPFIAGGSKAPYRWNLNGQTLVSADPALLWNPAPGEYALGLEGANSQIHFVVK
jgi:penicillin-binding protein 1C